MKSYEIQPSREAESSLESKLELERSYQTTRRALNETGVLEILPKKEALGIVDIDGEEDPIPSYESIRDVIESNPELKAKVEQGLTELIMTPLAPISILKDRLERALRRHAKEGKLFASRENPLGSPTSLLLNTENPIWIWDKFITGEATGNLVYYPDRFDQKSPGGMTKLELTRETKRSPFPGWIISLKEPTILLPREGQGKVMRGRKQLENNHTPKEYLDAIKKNQEQGLIIEDWLTSFIRRLHTTNEVSNDWDQSSALWLIGNYDKSSDYAPLGRWTRDDRGADVGRYHPGGRGPGWGALSAVRVLKT